MSGPTQARLLERLARWRTSLELHQRYLALPEPLYQRVQPWPAHIRPAPWIVDHALSQLTRLEVIVQSRGEDELLAEAFEMMQQLANLVGGQSLERCIPLVDATHEDPSVWAQAAVKPTSIPILTSNIVARATPPPSTIRLDEVERLLADARRLLTAGKGWDELADTIAGLAGRPSVEVVRAVLRARRTELIEPTPL